MLQAIYHLIYVETFWAWVLEFFYYHQYLSVATSFRI